MPTRGRQTDTLREMLRGFPDLDEVLAGMSLSGRQNIKLFSLLTLIGAYRGYLRLRRGLPAKIAQRDAGFRRVTDLKLRARSLSTTPVPGGQYLEKDEVARFEREGLLGPFPVISAKEAADLAEYANKRHETDFASNCLLGDEFVAVLQKYGQWTLNHSGLYQALRLKPFWDLLRSPEIAHRVASLLGDNVICWRSQFFEKTPGADGTFWHQNSAGEAVIFTSLNWHASYPNSTRNETRLSFAGRFTANDVKVYPGVSHDQAPTPEGNVRFSLDRVGCIQVHGTDEFGFNKIIPHLVE